MANPTIGLDAAVISSMGCVRKNNEDNFFVNGDYMFPEEVDAGAMFTLQQRSRAHLLAICDGMGGFENGERAAYLGVSSLMEVMPKIIRDPARTKVEVEAYVRRTSKHIKDEWTKSGKKSGSTVAIAFLAGSLLRVANVGDSRIYLLRGKRFEQLTHDHCEVYEQMMRGALTREQARLHPKNNAIFRYLGMSEPPANEMAYQEKYPVYQGDRILLCSDGLSDLLTHEEICEILALREKPLATAKRLVMRALEMGGKDNVTVIVADVALEGEVGSTIEPCNDGSTMTE